MKDEIRKTKGGGIMNIRHGDLALIGIEELPEGLKVSDSKVLMTGSGGNDHTFDHGKLYVPSEQHPFVVGYFKAVKNTHLLHPDHGTKVKGRTLRSLSVPPGFYELRQQHEDTYDGKKKVVD